MRFDWYQTTISDEPGKVIEALAKLGNRVQGNPSVGKMYRYEQGFEVHHDQRGVVARIACGGNGDNHAHAWATSDDAMPFAELVRERWPELHLVTRADSCADFIDRTAFDRLVRVGRRVAKEHRVSFPRLQDELNPLNGRTQYVGAPSSDYRARIYDKGWEVVGKALSNKANKLDPATVECLRVPGTDRTCHPSEWVRAELQARPKGREARYAAAQASPEQLWTFTSWASDLAKDALALDLERFYIRQRRETNDARALRFMCNQYAGVLQRLKADLGDWACVGKQIETTLAELEEERAAMGLK